MDRAEVVLRTGMTELLCFHKSQDLSRGLECGWQSFIIDCLPTRPGRLLIEREVSQSDCMQMAEFAVLMKALVCVHVHV